MPGDCLDHRNLHTKTPAELERIRKLLAQRDFDLEVQKELFRIHAILEELKDDTDVQGIQSFLESQSERVRCLLHTCRTWANPLQGAMEATDAALRSNPCFGKAGRARRTLDGTHGLKNYLQRLRHAKEEYTQLCYVYEKPCSDDADWLPNRTEQEPKTEDKKTKKTEDKSEPVTNASDSAAGNESSGV